MGLGRPPGGGLLPGAGVAEYWQVEVPERQVDGTPIRGLAEDARVAPYRDGETVTFGVGTVAVSERRPPAG